MRARRFSMNDDAGSSLMHASLHEQHMASPRAVGGVAAVAPICSDLLR